jgi:hypothetical protein
MCSSATQPSRPPATLWPARSTRRTADRGRRRTSGHQRRPRRPRRGRVHAPRDRRRARAARARPAIDPTGVCTLDGSLVRTTSARSTTGRRPRARGASLTPRGIALLTLALTGPGHGARADHRFAVSSDDPAVVQEGQETMYHALWELMHVSFEHRGLLEGTCATCGVAAVEARVTAAEADAAVVERGGGVSAWGSKLVEPVAVGDRVLCHARAAATGARGRPAGCAAVRAARERWAAAGHCGWSPAAAYNSTRSRVSGRGRCANVCRKRSRGRCSTAH